MELRAARVGGDPVEQQSGTASGFSSSIPAADAVQGFETVFAGDVAAPLNTLLHDRDVAVAPDEHRWDRDLVANSPGCSCGSG